MKSIVTNLKSQTFAAIVLFVGLAFSCSTPSKDIHKIKSKRELPSGHFSILFAASVPIQSRLSGFEVHSTGAVFRVEESPDSTTHPQYLFTLSKSQTESFFTTAFEIGLDSIRIPTFSPDRLIEYHWGTSINSIHWNSTMSNCPTSISQWFDTSEELLRGIADNKVSEISASKKE